MFSLFDLIAILLALTASFAWVNHVLLGLPNTIGLLLIGLVASLVLVATELVFPGTAVFREASRLVHEIHFSAPLLMITNGNFGEFRSPYSRASLSISLSTEAINFCLRGSCASRDAAKSLRR